MKTIISRDGTSIAYDTLGNGKPLILIDGALCYRSFGPMPKLAPLLAKYFTVYFYDRRGRGDSTDKKPYAVDREVEDIEALIKNAGGSAFVFGISSGAVLAMKGAQAGLNIPKLAMYEPPYVYEKQNGSVPPNHEANLKSLLANNRRGDAVKYFMVKMVGAPAVFGFIMSLLPVWKKLKAVAHTLPFDAAIMGDFTVPVAEIYSVKTPTLVAGGEKSPAALRTAVQSTADALPNGNLRWLEGQTHNVNVDALAPVLIEYFTT